MITRHDIVNNVTRFGESVWELPTVVLRGQSKTAGKTGLKEMPGTVLMFLALFALTFRIYYRLRFPKNDVTSSNNGLNLLKHE